MIALTKETPVCWTEAAHYNGGKEWFGYLYRCVEYPRLAKMVKYTRADRGTAVTWKVDGQPVADLDAAIVALDAPAILTVEEQAVFDRIPDDWTDLRKVEENELLRALTDKGVIQAERGRYRRTPDDGAGNGTASTTDLSRAPGLDQTGDPL